MRDNQDDVPTVCMIDEIERKMARQLARRRERAILEIQNAIVEEVERHSERIAEENARHSEVMADYQQELEMYNEQTNKGGTA